MLTGQIAEACMSWNTGMVHTTILLKDVNVVSMRVKNAASKFLKLLVSMNKLYLVSIMHSICATAMI